MRHHVCTVALAVLLVELVRAHQHMACVGAPDFQHYFSPSPQACTSYILCIRGEAHIGECENGLHFDVSQQGCANPEFVDCSLCGPYGFIKLPHPEDCSQFFECTFGQRKLRSCPDGFMFDRAVGTCNRAELVTTCPGFGDGDDGSPPVEPPGPPGPGGPGGPLPSCETGQVHFAHLTECNLYYLCIRGNLWEHSCPSELHWNERAMACDLVENAGCMPGVGGGTGDGGIVDCTTCPTCPGCVPDPGWDQWSSPRGTAPIRRLIRMANDTSA